MNPNRFINSKISLLFTHLLDMLRKIQAALLVWKILSLSVLFHSEEKWSKLCILLL